MTRRASLTPTSLALALLLGTWPPRQQRPVSHLKPAAPALCVVISPRVGPGSRVASDGLCPDLVTYSLLPRDGASVWLLPCLGAATPTHHHHHLGLHLFVGRERTPQLWVELLPRVCFRQEGGWAEPCSGVLAAITLGRQRDTRVPCHPTPTSLWTASRIGAVALCGCVGPRPCPAGPGGRKPVLLVEEVGAVPRVLAPAPTPSLTPVQGGIARPGCLSQGGHRAHLCPLHGWAQPDQGTGGTWDQMAVGCQAVRQRAWGT